ncbi:hypothetical protein IW261DRAFT_1571563 [Armillaria novae-zelandiae]|uniref:DUF6534 domain-containing protein n=1 Tax=Armillaria novae-zelandiae TaxID=153914 RepID=A0AA39NU17_9AGAR|nr:hypothetical protein IW261DRAFT_1571563 [Armillaria novae-zelandiae]
MSLDSSSMLPSVSETLGAVYIGVTIAAVLYGVTNLQAVIYYRRYPNDWWVYHYSVGFLWALDTVHVALSTYAVYVFLIHFFGDLDGALEYDSWSMKWQVYMNDVLAVYIQGLYALRLWQLGRHFHKTIVYFISLAVVASFGTVIYVVYDISITPNIASSSSLKTPIYVFFSTIATTDLIIAIPMFYYLHKSRTIILVPSTATVLLRLMRLVLMSGLATSACSLLTLITYIVWPKSLAFLGIHFVLSKLYINSLLAMLNSRSKHCSASQSMEDEVNSLPTTLRITPISSEGDVTETDINIPVPVKLGHSKELFDCQV